MQAARESEGITRTDAADALLARFEEVALPAEGPGSAIEAIRVGRTLVFQRSRAEQRLLKGLAACLSFALVGAAAWWAYTATSVPVSRVLVPCLVPVLLFLLNWARRLRPIQYFWMIPDRQVLTIWPKMLVQHEVRMREIRCFVVSWTDPHESHSRAIHAVDSNGRISHVPAAYDEASVIATARALGFITCKRVLIMNAKRTLDSYTHWSGRYFALDMQELSADAEVLYEPVGD